MSYHNLLIHRCDVYKQEIVSGQVKYGVPTEDEYTYPDTATYENVSCYFFEKENLVIPNEPGVRFQQRYLVHFLPHVDVQYDDKVIWDGVEFRLEKPRLYPGHHIEVMAVREWLGAL